jgi:hypothetical protein
MKKMPKMSVWKRFPELNEYLAFLYDKHPKWRVDEFIKHLKQYCEKNDISAQFTQKSVLQRLNSIKEEEDNLRELIKKEQEIAKIKAERDWLKKKQKYIAETNNLQEMIITELRNTVKAAPLVSVPKISLPKDKHATKESCILELSDIHFDENIKLEETQGLGFYNSYVAARRIQQIIDSIIRITKKQLKGYVLNTLHIFGLGDWVSGTIHEELLRAGQSNIINQSYGLAFILCQAFLELCQVFPEIIVHVMGGNHARLEKKPYFKEKYVNWDTVVGNTLAILLKNQKNIRFNIPPSIIDTVEIENHTFLLMHGDTIRSYGIMPYYGLQRAASQVELIKGGQFKEVFREVKSELQELKKGFNIADLESLSHKDLEVYIKATDQIFKKIIGNSHNLVDKICMGHFHDASTLLNQKILINGSVVGPNEYALAKFMGNKPMQRFFGVHHEKGISWEFSLRLDFADQDIENLRYIMYDKNKQFPEQMKILPL